MGGFSCVKKRKECFARAGSQRTQRPAKVANLLVVVRCLPSNRMASSCTSYKRRRSARRGPVPGKLIKQKANGNKHDYPGIERRHNAIIRLVAIARLLGMKLSVALSGRRMETPGRSSSLVRGLGEIKHIKHCRGEEKKKQEAKQGMLE